MIWQCLFLITKSADVSNQVTFESVSLKKNNLSIMGTICGKFHAFITI